MIDKKNAVYLFLGFFIAAYGKMSVISVAIFAVILVVILNKFMSGNDNNNSQPSSSDSLDDLEEL